MRYSHSSLHKSVLSMSWSMIKSLAPNPKDLLRHFLGHRHWLMIIVSTASLSWRHILVYFWVSDNEGLDSMRLILSPDSRRKSWYDDIAITGEMTQLPGLLFIDYSHASRFILLYYFHIIHVAVVAVIIQHLLRSIHQCYLAMRRCLLMPDSKFC